MPERCFSCNANVSRQTPSVQCPDCKKCFHLSCLKLPSLPDFSKFPELTWKCGDCSDKPLSSITNDVIIQKLDAVLADIQGIKNQQAVLTESINFYGNKIDDFQKELNTFKESVKTINTLEVDVSSLKAENKSLKLEIEALQQYSRLNNVEITGVPEKLNENVISIVKAIGDVLGAPVCASDIDAIHRVRSFSKGVPHEENGIRNCCSHQKRHFYSGSELGPS